MLHELIQQLARGESLAVPQVTRAVEQLIDAEISAEVKADFLMHLAKKGETTGEIAAFAQELRSRAVQPPVDDRLRAGVILDVCGTGGDRLNTFNISTTVAFVAAAAGVPVAKHGNRAITSACGSADLLEALGIPIELDPAHAAHALSRHQFAFFFAPRYHPAFKHIAPARKICSARGARTIFNFLGPLLNPARPSAQLIGVPRPELCEPMAQVLQQLGVRRGLVVSGQVGPAYLDEFSPLGSNCVVEFSETSPLRKTEKLMADLPLQPATLQDLAGGDAAANATLARQLLSGEERGPKRDALLLNAAAALFVADQVDSLKAGWRLAEELIDSGQASAKLREIQTQPVRP